MDIYSATETAYKNGYNKALEDFMAHVTCVADLVKVTAFDHKWAVSSEQLVEIKHKLEKI